MDEVRVERLIQKYKDSGELASEDPALVMLKKWPASKQYRYNSDRLPGLEQLVCTVLLIKLPPKAGERNRHAFENLVTHWSKKLAVVPVYACTSLHFNLYNVKCHSATIWD